MRRRPWLATALDTLIPLLNAAFDVRCQDRERPPSLPLRFYGPNAAGSGLPGPRWSTPDVHGAQLTLGDDRRCRPTGRPALRASGPWSALASERRVCLVSKAGATSPGDETPELRPSRESERWPSRCSHSCLSTRGGWSSRRYREDGQPLSLRLEGCFSVACERASICAASLGRAAGLAVATAK
jgi:hypothetical protein